jgi:hypothetical protein
MTHFQKSDQVVDGVRVQVLETGKGKPLVYFHGAGTEASVVRFTPANRSASGSSSSKPPLARKPNTVVIRRAGYGALGRLDRVQGVRFLRLTCCAADGPVQSEMTRSGHGQAIDATAISPSWTAAGAVRHSVILSRWIAPLCSSCSPMLLQDGSIPSWSTRSTG